MRLLVDLLSKQIQKWPTTFPFRTAEGTLKIFPIQNYLTAAVKAAGAPELSSNYIRRAVIFK